MQHHSSLVDRESSPTHANRAVAAGRPSIRADAAPEDGLTPDDGATVIAASEQTDAAVVDRGGRRMAGVLS